MFILTLNCGKTDLIKYISHKKLLPLLLVEIIYSFSSMVKEKYGSGEFKDSVRSNTLDYQYLLK